MATLRTDFTKPAQKNRKGSTVHYEDVAPNEDAFNFFRQPHVPAGAELPSKRRRKFILCFDGTGNKFSGTDADSNILKIYRMLDRDDSTQFHYYQPGIGTYVQSSSLSHSGRIESMKAAYMQAKDSAVGTSFDEHVMAGYRFLMRYYNVGDDIFLFGFSRGAYTARFLAEMLDHVGLLSAGNEEMARFAWKAFERWQQRAEKTEKEKQQKKFLMNYMIAFRETFSRPVRRIRFLGLFDTVNSVPQFESAWLNRSSFPYTARSTAKVIRHAVAIDERRAKFRQDLVGQQRPGNGRKKAHHYRVRHKLWNKMHGAAEEEEVPPDVVLPVRGRRPSKSFAASVQHEKKLSVPIASRRFSGQSTSRSVSPAMTNEDAGCTGYASDVSHDSMDLLLHRNNHLFDADDSEDEEQDIREVWFAGAHADIGGGWPLEAGEDTALSHIPLVWMVKEAQRAGLQFDPKKVLDLNCAENVNRRRESDRAMSVVPEIEVESPGGESNAKESQYISGDDLMPPIPDGHGHVLGPRLETVNGEPMPTVGQVGHAAPDRTPEAAKARATRFTNALNSAATKGRIHDVLQFNNGSTPLGVIGWNFMEYLPFRRMDLQPDGSWKSINWPLPKGETRDIPSDVVVHHTVIKRMEADPTYRPGNLIVGGGGRGVRFAPKAYGTGKWKLLREAGDPIGEVWVRDGPSGQSSPQRNGLLRRKSFGNKSILLEELLRDLEDILKLVMNVISFFFDLISRRLARQDKI